MNVKSGLLIVLALCVGGCAAGKPRSPFSASGFLSSRDLAQRKQAEVEKGTLRDLAAPELDGAGEQEYRIGAGDKIQIDVAKRPELSNLYLVNDGGFLVFPLIGSFPAGGLTPAELERKLEEALARYLRQPEVQATVVEYASQQVIVFGALGSFGADKQMGIYNLKKPVRLMPFLASLGGPRPDADLGNILIIRKSGAKDAVNFNRIVQQGDMRANVFVQGGDTVVVPSLKEGKNKVLVLGAVKTPGLYSFDHELTALEATTLAGSFIRASTPEKSFVIRTAVDNPYMMRVDLKRLLLRGETQRDIPLKKGDIVFVPPNTISKWNQHMADIRPTLEVLQYATAITIDIDTIAGIFDRGFGESTVELSAESAEQAARRTVLTTPRTATTTP